MESSKTAKKFKEVGDQKPNFKKKKYMYWYISENSGREIKLLQLWKCDFLI